MANINQEREPEIHELVTEMPSWAARGVLYLLALFLLVTFIWMFYSKIDVTISLQGVVVTEDSNGVLKSPITGKIKYILVREGSKVQKDQPLIQIDNTILHNNIKNLEIEMENVKEQLRQLQAVKGYSSEVIDKQNSILKLQTSLTELKVQLEKTTVTSPMDGLIVSLSISTMGANVQEGQELATILPINSKLLIQTQLPTKHIPNVKIGMATRLKLDAYPYQEFGTATGIVQEIFPNVEKDDKMGYYYKITILPDEQFFSEQSKIKLKPGLTTNIEMIVGQRSMLSTFFQ